MNGIVISGRAGAGKSTLASLIVEKAARREVPAVKLSFGDELKREVWELFGVKKGMIGGRDKLIEYGEEKRLADPYYWIRPVAHKVRLAQASGVLPVIDDMRFLREYEWASDNRLMSVRITAPEYWRSEKLYSLGLDGSFAKSDEPGETEIAALLYDFHFTNGPGMQDNMHRLASSLLDTADVSLGLTQ